ncbi:hypothetical protein HYU10_04845, partial [Candidatus Woesearchaeota archaeon]|nr:hypothetical protein [Candidatus Woesearchaeota archaeon]
MPKDRYSRFTFLLLAISAAIGIQGYWGFAKYSNKYGGAFLIAYIVAMIAAGLPLLMLETGLARKYKTGIMGIFAKTSHLKNFGWFVMLSSFAILAYYSVLLAWNLIYFLVSFGTPWKGNPEAYFAGNVLQLSESIWQIGSISLPVFVALLLSLTCIYFMIRNGVATIRKTMVVLLPASLALALIAMMKVLTAGGASGGLSHFLQMSMGSFLNPGMWKNAFMQALLSLGLGLGFYSAYSSGSSEKFAIKEPIMIILAKIAFTILVSLMIFGAAGAAAHSSQKEVKEVWQDSPGSQFILLPKFISTAAGPTFTSLIIFLAFSMLTASGLAAIAFFLASSLAGKFRIQQQKASIIVIGLGFLAGLILTTNSGLYFMDLMEHFIYGYYIILALLMECILAGWLLKGKEIEAFMSRSNKLLPG